MRFRMPLLAVILAALNGCSGHRSDVPVSIRWTFDALAPTIAVGLESDRSFASGERLFAARCGGCHALGAGSGGLATARLRLSVDEWLTWVTGGSDSKRCVGCGSGFVLDGLEQGAVLDLMAILVHGENPTDAAFQSGGR